MTKMGLSTTKGAAWDAAAPRCGAALTWYGILLATPMSEKYAFRSSPAAGEERKAKRYRRPHPAQSATLSVSGEGPRNEDDFGRKGAAGAQHSAVARGATAEERPRNLPLCGT
jgi:hypothetical protein